MNKLKVPEKLRERVMPRRSLPDYVHAPTEKAATRELQRIAKAYVKSRYGDKTTKQTFEAGLDMGKDKGMRVLRREAHALLCKPSLDAVRSMSVDALAVADQMAHRATWDAALVTPVAVTKGVAAAVEVMARALDLDLASNGDYTQCVFVVRNDKDHIGRWVTDWTPLRHAVCAATDAEYEKAKKVAIALRKKLSPVKRARLAFAFPDEPWSREEVRAWLKDKKLADEINEISFLFGSCDDVEIARKFIEDVPAHAFDYAIHLPPKDALALFADAIPPRLVRPKYGPLHKTPPRDIAMAVALFDTKQAAKILAPYFGNAILGPLVAAYFQDHPELRDALGETAKGKSKVAEAAQRVLQSGEKRSSGPIARDADVPRVLRDRPWRASKERAAATALALSIPKDAEERIELTASERELEFEEANEVRDMTAAELNAWRAEIAKKKYAHADWETVYKKLGRGVEYTRVPEDEGLAAWNEGRAYLNGTYVEWLARHGTKAIDGFLARDWVKWLAYQEVDDEPILDVLAHIVSPRLAPVMARIAQRKNFKRPAVAWLCKHAELASLGLVPDALGKPGEARDVAEDALLLMAHKGEGDAIRAATREYGDDAARAIDALLARDPLAIDATVPKAPDFLRPGDLAPVRLKSGARLGDDARDALLEMLRVAPLDPLYPGVAMVRDACDADSLGAFARDLVEQWVLAGANGRFDWMLFAAAQLPSEDGTRRLAQLARDWARRDRKKALRGCMALGAIGDDRALLHLGHIAATSRFDDLRDAARGLLDEAAAARDLTRDALEDRIVPDLDLGPEGTIELAFGKRKLTISFDEGLRPFVVGEKSFPRTSTAEEKSAKARYDALKADAAAIADRQIRRFEAAMVSGRAWPKDDFETYVVRHPLLRHLARRVVWERVGAGTFRVAEDGTCANVRDEPVMLDGGEIRVAHPARMSEDERRAWAALFGDYRIAQPFEQLGRAVASRVSRDTFKAAARKVLGTLESRGWRRNDRGHVTVYFRPLLAGGEARLSLSPGISMENLKHEPDQTIERVELPKAVDPIDLAEITRDLDALM